MKISELLNTYRKRFGSSIGAYLEIDTFVVNPYGHDSVEVAANLRKMGHTVLNKEPKDASNRKYSLICKL